MPTKHSAASPKRLAVIGAGISGLACATRLQEAGHAVEVFDKSRGPAGRMSTRRGDDWQADHGAQYFTARDPAFRAEVERWLTAGVAARWQPTLAVLGGSDGHESDPALERFVGVPGMTATARWLAQTVPLTLNATLKSLQVAHGKWYPAFAETLEREIGGFDAVVLAVPSPQALPLLQPIAPALAEIAASAKTVGCWTLMLRYAGPSGLPFDAAFVNSGPLRWVARDSSKPGRQRDPETWVLQASAAWSEAHMEETPEEVAPVLLDAFAAIGAPMPAAWTAHRWRYADNAPALDIGCAWDAASGIGMCGDWLGGGKVQGAWCSGRTLADQILQSL